MVGQPFDAFAAENASLSEEDFLGKFTEPFLISEGALPPPSNKQLAQTTDDTPVPGKRSGQPVVVLVRQVAPGQRRIVTVGRGKDCDISIDTTQVSKRHAYFAREEDGAWCIADAESTNGTYVDGKKLPPHEKHALSDSEAIRFSPDLCFRFFGPEAFFRYMSMRARMKS
jgi:pSer/pThr/pTyr-binding forkhead associated (FHA) protein